MSDRLYCLRVFAILSVILAHSSYTAVQTAAAVKLLAAFSAVGVVVFFTLSGYFFRDYEKGFGFFFRKKILWLLIPWAFWGVATYAVNFLQKSFSFRVLSALNYLIGNGSYLYFLSVLTILFLVYYRLHRYLWFHYLMIGLSLVSIVLTTLEIVPVEVSTEKWLFMSYNPYLNPLNWAGFFSVGALLRKYRIFERWYALSKPVHACIGVFLLAGWLTLALLSNGSLNYYWAHSSLPNELLLFGVLLEVVFLVPGAVARLFAPVGKWTLPVYLMHIVLVTHILTGRFSANFPLAVLRPVLTLAICCGLLWVIRFLSEKTRVGSAVCGILGIPRRS